MPLAHWSLGSSLNSFSFLMNFCFILLDPGTEPRALHTLGKSSAAELHPEFCSYF